MNELVYSFTENPSYHEKIRKIQNTDPVNAETIVNPLIEKMLENTHFVKQQLNGLEIRFMKAVGLKEIPFTIQPQAWQKTNTGRYPYTASIVLSDVLETHLPAVFFDGDSLETAFTNGISPQVQTQDGGLCFSSQRAPTIAISGVCRLWTPGIGGFTALPAATVDRIGGIKASDSIQIDADGTAHAITQLTENNFASNEDINAMLNDVYGQ